MTWVDLSSAFTYGSKLTSTQMQNLRDNIKAAMDGDSGAPPLQSAAIATGAVDQAAIGASAVGQGELKTTTTFASGSLSVTTGVNINAQEYSFGPHIYGSNQAIRVVVTTSGGASNDMRFGLYNSSGSSSYSYTVRWRYVTSTDEPFIFILRDKHTGEVKHLWMGEDPPPGYWGLDKEPENFEWPIIPDKKENFVHELLFKTEQDLLNELLEISRKEKKDLHSIMNDFELNKSKNLYVKKNLLMT